MLRVPEGSTPAGAPTGITCDHCGVAVTDGGSKFRVRLPGVWFYGYGCYKRAKGPRAGDPDEGCLVRDRVR